MKRSPGLNLTVHWGDSNGPLTAALSPNHSYKLSGNGSLRSATPNAPTNHREDLHTFYKICSQRTTTILLLMLLRVPGGEQVTPVPVMMAWHCGGLALQPPDTGEEQGIVVPLPGVGNQTPLGLQGQETQEEVAALEMFGTFILTMLLCQRSGPHPGPVQLPLASDDQGNIYGLLNEYSKKMPTAGLLMEVMFPLTADTCALLPTRVKRDFNQWADDLTHPSFTGFDGDLQLQVSPLLDDLKIFPWILQHLDQQGDLPHAVETEPAAPVPALKRRRKGWC